MIIQSTSYLKKKNFHGLNTFLFGWTNKDRRFCLPPQFFKINHLSTEKIICKILVTLNVWKKKLIICEKNLIKWNTCSIVLYYLGIWKWNLLYSSFVFFLKRIINKAWNQFESIAMQYSDFFLPCRLTSLCPVENEDVQIYVQRCPSGRPIGCLIGRQIKRSQ